MEAEQSSEAIQNQTDGTYRTKYGITPKLTSFNYRQWARSIQIFLRAENALAITLGEEPEPPAQQVQRRSDWIMREGKALAIIYNSCTMITQQHVEDVEGARAMWDMLKEKFDSNNSRAGQLEVRRSFNQSRVQSGQTIENYIALLLRYRKTLAGTNNAITDETFKAHLLSTLSKCYDNYVDILMEQQDQHTIDSLVQRLLEREKTLQSRQGESASGSALIMRHSRDQRTSNHSSTLASRIGSGPRHARGAYSGRVNYSHQPWRTGRGGSRTTGERFEGKAIVCWHCGKEGHRRSECRNRGQSYRGRQKSRPREHLGEQSSGAKSPNLNNTGYVSMATSAGYALATKRVGIVPASLDRLWLVDSGASNHIANRRADFLTYTLLAPARKIYLGDNSSVSAIGIGTIRLYLMEQDCYIRIEALHIPVMSLSLLSVSCLCATMNVSFNEVTCEISRRNEKGPVACLARLDMSTGLWKVIGGPVNHDHKAYVNISATGLAALPTLERWHQRLGHLNVNAVKTLIPISDRDSNDAFSRACSICIHSKQQRKFARLPVQRASEPFELVHSDMCGPIAVSSHGGARYFILYIDDYSRYTWVYFLSDKSSTTVTAKFQEFTAWIWTNFHHLKYKVHRFRCDNGKGEYDNSLFRGILRVTGIQYEPAPPYTQHKNGVSERMIRTITTKARSLLQDSSLPSEFWAEAIQTAAYLHARSPTRANAGKTPYELLYSSPPTLLHLRRFGCLVYKLIPKSQRGEKKFGHRSQECIMLGYVHNTAKIWRLWNPETKRVIQASDVYFDEDKIVSASTGDHGGPDVLKAILPEGEDSGWDDEEECKSDFENTASVDTTPRIEAGDPKSITTNENGTISDPEGESCKEDLQGSSCVDGKEVAPHTSMEVQQLRPTEEISSERSVTPSSVEIQSRTMNDSCSEKRKAGSPHGIDTSTLRHSKRRLHLPNINLAEQECEEATSTRTLESTEMTTISDDSLCYEDAVQYKHWCTAMQEEYDSLRQHKTWEPRSAQIDYDKKIIGCKWVYRTKIDADGKKRYKARLVIKGYEQVYSEDYDETFAPVARLSTLRMLLALSIEMGWYIHQMDVVATFLYPAIDETVYMEPPPGIEWLEKGFGNKICQLRKALYGLKQAPRLWFEEIDTYLRQIGYTRSLADTNLYISKASIVILYVDDILIASSLLPEIAKTKYLLNQKYRMKDLGQVRQFLGLEIGFGDGWVSLKQSRFIATVLERFGMSKCNGVSTPMEPRAQLRTALRSCTGSSGVSSSSSQQSIGEAALPSLLSSEDQRRYQGIVGSLMYLAVASRPDLAFTVSILSKFNASANTEHMVAAKRALRYIRYTMDLGIQYTKAIPSVNSALHGYSDADWAGDLEDRKSTTGYLFLVANGAVSWQARKQSIVALSTTEAEYVACSEGCREAVALRRIYEDLKNIQVGTGKANYPSPLVMPATMILVDNQSAISLVQNPRFHRRTKHIELKYHYVREIYQSRSIDIDYVSTHLMTADLLTKPLTRELHWRHTKGMGMVGSMHELGTC